MSPAPLSESRDPLPLPSSSSAAPRTHRSNFLPEHPDDLELESIYIDDTKPHQFPEDPATPSDYMSRSRKDRPHREDGRPSSSNMASSVEYRRKNASVDDEGTLHHSTSAQQTEALLRRDSFSLDDDHEKPASGSLLKLSPSDQRNFALLVLLYFLQGVPMGLAMGSVPFLLKKSLSYGEIGVFSLASYPYSMKLLWSPVVDAIWSQKIGRRKSWIVPIQTLSSVMLLWLGANADRLMGEASSKLYTFTFVFFTLVMLCATQDVAVDGESLMLLHPRKVRIDMLRQYLYRLGSDPSLC